MLRFARRALARFVALVRADADGVRAGIVALLISTATGLVAGLTLGKITGTLDRLPGLVILLPAAVGMRGNVFGALGSRLGTAVHTGEFVLSRRLNTLVGQNLASSVLLSTSLAWILAVVAKGLAAALGVDAAISLTDFVVISVVGGLIPIVVVMAITVGVTALSARRGYDVDNVAAPIVTAAADSVTLPSLWLATHLLDIRIVTPALGVICTVLGIGSLIAGLRVTRYATLRGIVRESVPVLVVSGIISMGAGIAIQTQIDELNRFAVLLVIIPPLLSLSGSLAGILSARLATKLHLGLLDPARFSFRVIVEDLVLVYVMAAAVFIVLGGAADLLGSVLNLTTPGMLDVATAALLAGMLATTLTNVTAYFSAVGTYRLSLDPDNYGIPLTAAVSDLLGAIALLLCLAMLGLV